MVFKDSTNVHMAKLQVAQNNLVRVLGNVSRAENLPIKTLLSNQQMLSVNQISAQIKLTEIWKAINQSKYPIKVTKQLTPTNARTTRGVTAGKLIEIGSSSQSLNSFIGDATRLWNKAPTTTNKSTSLYSVEIKKFVSTILI